MGKDNQILEELTSSDYKYGFETKLENDSAPKGLNEDIIRFISAKKNEPEWLLEWRLKAFRHWLTLKRTQLAQCSLPAHRLSGYYLLFRPKKEKELKSLEEVDPELLETFKKLGISLEEQKRLAGRCGRRCRN